MEVTKKQPVSRASKASWIEKKFGMKLPGTPKSNLLQDYAFEKDFSPERLKQIKNESARGLFKSRLGSFKDVVESAEKAYETFNNYKTQKKVSKGLKFWDKQAVTGTEVIGQFEQLIRDAEEWLGHFTEEGEREKLGTVSNTKVQADKQRKSKMTACQDFIHGARIAINQIKLLDLQGTDDGSLERLQRDIATVTRTIDSHAATREDRERGRGLDAELLIKVAGAKKASSGTSDVSLIKAPDGTVAYAFKTIESESDQTGLPKGAAAVREVVMSRLCTAVKDDYGLDFKWPKASLAALPGTDGKTRPGVLIDGVSGVEPHLRGASGADDTDEAKEAKLEQQAKKLLKKLPPADLQQMVLCNLAFGQYDMKWDNCFLQEDDDGEVAAAPFDGGAAFPDLNLFMDTVSRGGVPGLPLLSYANEPLKCTVDGKEVETGKQPISEHLRKSILKINEKDMYQQCLAELADLKKQGLDPVSLGMDRGARVMAMSIKGLKELLTSNPTISLEDLLDAYRTKVMVPLAKDFEGDWHKQIRLEYQGLQSLCPGLLPDLDDKSDLRSVYGSFLVPMQRRYFAQIIELGGVKFLQRDDIKCKVPLTFMPSQVIRDVVARKLSAKEKALHPHIFGQLK